jgi:imidazolonepropionase-like amidohydrolase
VAIGEIEELSLWAAIVHLPVAIRKKTGKAVTPFQARKIQQTILGDVENPPALNQAKVTAVLDEMDLESRHQKEIIEILDKMVAEPHRLCHEVYLESAEIAKKLGIPIIVHYALESMDWLIELARKYARGVNILASHCDSVSFSNIEESITMTKKLKKLGIITNATSYMREHVDLTDINVRLFEERLVDTICTDAAGQQDSELYFIARIVEEKLANLPELIAMATNNVAKYIPNLAPHRGLIQKGKIADLVMVDGEHVSDVEKVVIGGQVVIEDGYHARKEIPLMGPPPFGPDGRLYQRDIYTKLPSRLSCELAEKE